MTKEGNPRYSITFPKEKNGRVYSDENQGTDDIWYVVISDFLFDACFNDFLLETHPRRHFIN